MKIICTRQNLDGSYDEVGTNNQFLTSQYKTVSGFLRYGVPDTYKNKKIRLQVWRGDNIYRDPDEVRHTTVYAK
jgi:hypothetical protein